jgi:hypothetical protein
MITKHVEFYPWHDAWKHYFTVDGSSENEPLEVAEMDRESTAAASFTNFLLSSKDKYRVVLMTSVGLVMRDQQGRELSDNHLVDLWWFKITPHVYYTVQHEAESVRMKGQQSLHYDTVPVQPFGVITTNYSPVDASRQYWRDITGKYTDTQSTFASNVH